MDDEITTLTERGQVSMPARLRRQLALQPGQKLRWQQISDRECRLTVLKPGRPKGASAMRGFARQLRSKRRSTASWIGELREGER